MRKKSDNRDRHKYLNKINYTFNSCFFPYGSAYEIAAYLNQENISREPIYMMTGHIAYWFLDTKPLTKSSTHPSNIAKDYILKLIVGSDTSTQEEMRKILTQKPKFIVTQEDIWYLKNKPQAKLLLEDTLNQNYELIKQIRGNQIYRRLNL